MIRSLGASFNEKFENFRDFELLKPTFLYGTYVEILLKRMDRVIAQRHSRDSAHGLPVLHCLREVMHTDF